MEQALVDAIINRKLFNEGETLATRLRNRAEIGCQIERQAALHEEYFLSLKRQRYFNRSDRLATRLRKFSMTQRYHG